MYTFTAHLDSSNRAGPLATPWATFMGCQSVRSLGPLWAAKTRPTTSWQRSGTKASRQSIYNLQFLKKKSQYNLHLETVNKLGGNINFTLWTQSFTIPISYLSVSYFFFFIWFRQPLIFHFSPVHQALLVCICFGVGSLKTQTW